MRFIFVATLGIAVMGCTAQIDETGGAEGALHGDFCGGIAGITCADGYTCVDDPGDDCDPERGGADCGGICVRDRRDSCDARGRTYISRDLDECAVIRFLCVEGSTPFSDECGCGCERDPGRTCRQIGLCAPGYTWDERACNCLPDHGVPCGPRTCPAGELCCNDSCGICTPPGGFCTLQLCLTPSL